MKFYGQFDPPVDKILYERYFKNKTNGISLECGAFNGLTENNTKFFEENFNWKTINIEPLPYIYNELVKNRPNSINLELALSNNNYSKKIRVYNLREYGINNTNASLNHLDKHKELLESNSNGFQEFTVKCRTYKNIIEILNLKELDLFTLDVEGHEPEVIEGMLGCDVLPKVFVIEHGHRNTSYFPKELLKLNKKYKLDYVSNVNSFFILDE